MKLIYIAGDDRSGSTVLDMMMSGHSEITSLGESHQLKAYATKDTRFYTQTAGDRPHEMVCYCGSSLESCSFWQGVRRELGRPLESLDLKIFFLRSDLQDQKLKFILKKFFWGLFSAIPSLYAVPAIHRLVGGDRVGRESRQLYEAVDRVAGTRYVLDSSKSPHRMCTIAKEMPQEMKVILLCRDFKGTIHSKMKRGRPMLKAALQWKWIVRQMEQYSRILPQQNVLRVKYENICEQTEKEMRRICEFLDLDFERSMLQRNVEGLHHLGGSPSKYAGSEKEVRLDRSYEDHLSSAQRQRLYRLVKKEADLWGYAP